MSDDPLQDAFESATAATVALARALEERNAANPPKPEPPEFWLDIRVDHWETSVRKVLLAVLGAVNEPKPITLYWPYYDGHLETYMNATMNALGAMEFEVTSMIYDDSCIPYRERDHVYAVPTGSPVKLTPVEL